MNLRDLTYLVKVAELQHFGKAAKACFVSQPTLSMQLKKLEQQLGVILFERNNKQVRLTTCGEQIVERAKRILQEVNELQRLAKNAQDPYAKELRLGIIPTIAPYLLPKLMLPLTEAYPKLTIQLYESQTAVLLQRLKAGELDAAILALPVAEEGLISHSLYQEPFYVAVPRQHPLAKQKAVQQAELEGLQLLLLDDGHCLRDQALVICQAVGATEQQNFRAASLETLRQMVGAGIGVTLIPKMAIAKDDKRIVYVPFKKPQPQRQVGIVWRSLSADKNLLAELAVFIENCLASFN